MKPHEERVVVEKNELDEKLSKLKIFLQSTVFNSLSLENQNLLNAQSIAMAQYSEILGERIKLFAS